MMGGGGPLPFRLDGTGEALLLLNGGMMSYGAWDPLVPPLAARFQVLPCELRAQLRSPGPPPPDLAGHADDLVALLDHLGIDSCHVVGTSFGGLVGIFLAARHPGRTRSLVAVTVGDHATPELARGVARLMEACQLVLDGGSPDVLTNLMAALFYSPSYVASNREVFAARAAQLAQLPRVWWEGLCASLATLERFDLRPLLSRVVCPTLVMAADRDIVFLPECGRAVADAIPGARFELVPDSGHVLIQEQPLRFIELTLGFLGGKGESGEGRGESPSTRPEVGQEQDGTASRPVAAILRGKGATP